MKLLQIILLLLILPGFVQGQTRRQIDSVRHLLQRAPNDTVRMAACSILGSFYDDINADSGLYYCNKGIAIAEALDLNLNKAEMMAFMSWPLTKTGNYPQALRVISQGLEIAEDPSNEKNAWMEKKGETAGTYQRRVIGLLYTALEFLYLYVGNYEKQISVGHEAITRLKSARDTFNLAGTYNDIGDSYLELHKLDSALFYQQESLYYYSKLTFDNRRFEGGTYTSIGTIYEQKGNIDLARENYQKAIEVSEQHDNPRHEGNASLQLASLYRSLKKADSGFLYARKALVAFTLGGYKKEMAIAYQMISDYYHNQNNTDSSFKYLRLATFLNDSLSRIEKTRLQEFQVAAFNQQLELQQQQQERVEKEGKLKTIAIVVLIAVFSTIGFLLYRNNRQKQKANLILQEKNSQIERAFGELKATQKQLIQSEKMASLGELTAGIVHEIQNPLNFVNNFTEVNNELIEELERERSKVKGERNEELEDEILKDIKSNEQKINQHGKRADAIVKGMLQHSRTSSGQKEPTDLNALCDEYLRLGYHGLRAKDKNFNAEIKTDFDDSIGKINVVPQDIGRVILNLINNAFFAVSERQRAEGTGYMPTVTVTTKRFSTLSLGEVLGTPLGGRGEVLITVVDNGNGIPKNIVDKIFHPFFTTKPAGQGTGLGLSLAYDIVKAHGGEIKVDTREGQGSVFTIDLPITSDIQ